MKRAPKRYVWPSSVTLRSCIASSKAACVFGGVRLISSASSTSQKIGPFVSVNVLVWKLNRLVPTMSPGIRSGVNWMRPNLRLRLRAKHWARSVFAVPGGPSSRIWPPEKSATSMRLSVSDCPMIALATSPRMRSASARTRSRVMNHIPSPTVEFARHAHRIARVLGILGFAEERAQRLHRIVAPAQPVEQVVEHVVPRVRRHAHDACNTTPDCQRIARRDAMFTARHGDQGRGVVGKRLLAERENAPALYRRTEAHRGVHTHQERCEQRTQSRSEQRRFEGKAQNIGRSPVAGQSQIENDRTIPIADRLNDRCRDTRGREIFQAMRVQ